MSQRVLNAALSNLKNAAVTMSMFRSCFLVSFFFARKFVILGNFRVGVFDLQTECLSVFSAKDSPSKGTPCPER